MNIGDYVRIYFDGKGSSGEVIEGIVLHCFEDRRAKQWKDNNSRWISSRILVDGRPRIADLYWDDDFEVLSSS